MVYSCYDETVHGNALLRYLCRIVEKYNIIRLQLRRAVIYNDVISNHSVTLCSEIV